MQGEHVGITGIITPFAHASMRIHPLTRVDHDAKGAVWIICHIELKDAWGDTCKGTGKLQVQLYGPRAGTTEGSAFRIWRGILICRTWTATRRSTTPPRARTGFSSRTRPVGRRIARPAEPDHTERPTSGGPGDERAEGDQRVSDAEYTIGG